VLIYFLITVAIIIFSIVGYNIFISFKAKFAQKKGKELETTGKLNEAVTEYEKVLTAKPNVETLWRLAILHEKIGEYNKAISRLNAIIKKGLYPKVAGEYEVNLKIALLYFKTDQDEEAFKAFIKLYRSNQKDTNILSHLVILTLGQRRCEIASRFLKELLAINDADPNSYMLQGICQFETGEYKAAAVMFEKAIERDAKDDWRLIFLIAITHYLASSFDKGILAFENLLKHRVDVPKIMETSYQLLGRCYLNIDKPIDAAAIFEQGLMAVYRLQPDYNPTGLEEDCVAASIKCKDVIKADIFLNKMIEEDPDSFKLGAIKEMLTIAIKDQKDYLKKKKEIEEEANEVQTLLDKQKIPTPTLEEIDVTIPFTDYLNNWEWTDLVGDIVWQFANLDRKADFEPEKYLSRLNIKKPKLKVIEEEKKTPSTTTITSNLCEHYSHLEENSFVNTSRKVIERLNYNIVTEKYNPEEVFLSIGDGIDFIVTQGKKEDEKIVIQIRRWKSNAIGELVIKDLAESINSNNATQGVFITTGTLSEDAMDYVEQNQHIRIIQGQQLDFLLKGLIIKN